MEIGSDRWDAARAGRILFGVMVVVVVAVGFMAFPASGRDDVFLTCWVARALTEHGMPLNYNLEQLEQTSSVGYTLILAFVEILTDASMITIARVMSMIGSFSLAIVVYATTKRATSSLLSLTPFVLYWQSSGMEATFAAAGLVVMVWWWSGLVGREGAVSRGVWSCYAATSAFVGLLRPEFLLVCPLVLFAHAVWRRRVGVSREVTNVPREWWLLGVTTMVFAVVSVGRRLFFGAWFPHPVGAKSGGLSFDQVHSGLDYFAAHTVFQSSVLPALSLLTLVVVVGVASRFQQCDLDPAVSLSAVTLGVYSLFIVLSGGDWMENGRFFVHMAGVWAIVVGHELGAIRPRRLRYAVTCSVFALLISLFVSLGSTSRTYAVWEQPTLIFDASVEDVQHEAGAFLESQSFWIRRNAAHRRDAIMAELADQLVDQIPRTHRPVRVVSLQMGLLAYRLKETHGPDVMVRDLYGLATSDFVGCYDEFGVGRGRRGRRIPNAAYAVSEGEMASKCGFERADIIVGFFRGRQRVEQASESFQVVYAQSGSSMCKSRSVGGHPFELVRPIWCIGQKMDAYIAVRRDLLERIGDPIFSL